MRLSRSLWIPRPWFSWLLKKVGRSLLSMVSSMPMLYSGHCLTLQLVGTLMCWFAGGDVSKVGMDVSRDGSEVWWMICG